MRAADQCLAAVETLIGGALAIDVTVVGELPVLIVEQQLMADIAGIGHVKDRAGIDIVVLCAASVRCRAAWRLQSRQILVGRQRTEAKHGGDRDHDDKYLPRSRCRRAHGAFAGRGKRFIMRCSENGISHNTPGADCAAYAVDTDMAKKSIMPPPRRLAQRFANKSGAR